MDVKLPDGTVIQNVPDGISKSDLTAKLKANGYDISKLEQPAAPSGPAQEPMMDMGSRPLQFTSPVDQPARAIYGPKTTRQVPQIGPIDRAIYEAGGRVTDAAASVGLPPEVAAGAGYLTNLAGQVGTTFIGGNAGAKLEPAAQNLGTYLMKKALNPTVLQAERGVADSAAKTMLTEGNLVTRNDVSKMTNDIVGINAQIMDMVKNSPDTVNKTRTAMYARRAYDKWVNQVNKAKDINAVTDAVKEFLNDPTIAENMPALVAQQLKQGTYRALGSRAYQPGAPGITAGVDAEKDLAYGLKTELASKHPQITGLNDRESSLIEARKLAERALAKQDARGIAGYGLLAHSPEAGMGWLAERSPLVKSLLAHYFYGYADPEMLGRVTGATIGAHSASADQNKQ